MGRKGLLEEYKDYLLINKKTPLLTLAIDVSSIQPVKLHNDERKVSEYIKGVVHI